MPLTATEVGPRLRPSRRGMSGRQFVLEKPNVIGLATAQEDIQLVIAQHALCLLTVDEPANPFEDGRTVRPAVYQVANKDEAAAFGMTASRGVAQSLQQGVEGVDFLGNLHGADFGGEGGAGTADYDDGGDERAEFARHRDGDGGGNVADGAKAAELVSGLESEDQADKKGDEGEDGDSAHADVECLRDGALKANGFALKGSHEGVVGRLTTERGESADVGQTVGYGTADLGENLHTAFNTTVATVEILRTSLNPQDNHQVKTAGTR